MKVNYYTKKPVTIQAIQYTVDNTSDVLEFCPTVKVSSKKEQAMDVEIDVQCLIIPTLEGDHIVSIGDFIIKGVNGEFYPCKPDIFNKTYDLA